MKQRSDSGTGSQSERRPMKQRSDSGTSRCPVTSGRTAAAAAGVTTPVDRL